MAKKKQVEKLGEVIGNSHPILGCVLIFIGIALGVSVLGYDVGQDLLLKHYFEPFLASTDTNGQHICGKLGATVSLFFMLVFGAATYMLPLYVLWFGIGCLRRKACVITKWEGVSVALGIISLAVLSSVFQASLGSSAPLQNAQFPCGWGGKIGFLIYEDCTKVLLDKVGNWLLFGSLYLFTLVVVFVESPTEAAKEIGNAIVVLGKWLWRAISVVGITLVMLPKNIIVSIFSRKNKDFDVSDIQVEEDEDTQAKGKTKKVQKVSAEDVSQENEDDLDFDTPSSEKIDIKELSAFANKMGRTKNDDPALIDIVEMSVDSEEENLLSNDNLVEAEDEINVVDFSNVEIKIPEQKPVLVSQPVEVSPAVVEDVKVVTSDEAAEAAEIPQEKKPPKKRNTSKYVFPALNLLAHAEKNEKAGAENYLARMTEIINVIGQFGVKVLPGEAFSGPVITRYEVKPAPGVKISRITNLEDDITAGIKAEKVRMIAPVPGRGTVGIEVPNINRQNVSMREVLESKQWRNNSFEIPIALGKDATGVPIVANLKKMTHALIAGSTNSGKSVCINTIIISMLYKMTPEDLRLIMIDPKMVELQGYNSVPHMLIPVVSDVKKAAAALKWLTGEMMRRYSIFQKMGVRNIDGFNAKILKDKEEMARAEAEFASMSPEERQASIQASSEIDVDEEVDIPKEKMPYIVCIIDELADLMSVVGKEVEPYIARITQLARAAGIHMIIATQRPDVKVITGKIKNNLPTRIAFKVTSQIDSRTILDCKGAESLIGWGDMLFMNNGAPDVIRAQGAYLSDEEIESIVEALKVNGEPQYAEEVQAQIDASDDDGDEIAEGSGGKFNDSMVPKAIAIIRSDGKVSISYLQRRLGIGYPRAAKIVDELEEKGYIGPDNGTGKRDILID